MKIGMSMPYGYSELPDITYVRDGDGGFPDKKKVLSTTTRKKRNSKSKVQKKSRKRNRK